MKKLFKEDATNLIVKMSKAEKYQIKKKAYGNMQTVSEYVREQLCK